MKLTNITKCRACGSTSLTWDTVNRVRNGIQQNRLNTSDVACVFFLGCDQCSETLALVSADRVAVLLNADAKQQPEVERLRESLACALKSAENINAEAVALRIQLSEHQWHYEPYDDHYHRDAGHYCPSCGGEQDSGHKEGCEIDAALSPGAVPRVPAPDPNEVPNNGPHPQIDAKKWDAMRLQEAKACALLEQALECTPKDLRYDIEEFLKEIANAEPSAPVERDERAAYEHWYTKTRLPEVADGRLKLIPGYFDRYGSQHYEVRVGIAVSGTYIRENLEEGFTIWNGRAALERKP